MKKINLFWSFSLIVIGVCSIILGGSNLLSIKMPDLAVRIIGIIDLIALPILAYTTVKKAKTYGK